MDVLWRRQVDLYAIFKTLPADSWTVTDHTRLRMAWDRFLPQRPLDALCLCKTLLCYITPTFDTERGRLVSLQRLKDAHPGGWTSSPPTRSPVNPG